MKDQYGDKIKVSTFVGVHYAEVSLEVWDGDASAYSSLSPKQARKLAAKLVAAAEKVETADAERAADGLV